MKNILVYGLFLFTTGLIGCDKNEPAKPAENPVTTLLSEESGALKVMDFRESSFQESGIIFSSSVAGKLTQLGSKLPDAGIYVVTVWDFDSGQVVIQKTVEQEIPNKLSLIDTDVVPLTIHKKYLVSINNKTGQRSIGSYSISFKASGGDILPTTKGSITLHASRTVGGAVSTFPTSNRSELSTIYGVPEFTFIPD